MEKQQLPTIERSAPPPQRRSSRFVAFTLLSIALCITWFSHPLAALIDRIGSSDTGLDASKSHKCHQPPALFPSETDNTKKAFDFLYTQAFQNASVARLSGAVQVKTESFDDLGEVGEDERWDVFFAFHQYLKVTFPRIHRQLKVEKVNTHGLLYTWAGSEEKKKPVVVMAHQDVVPVDPDTVDSWTYPPWSGHFDGENLWGRGVSDCKNTLIGAMETIEVLLEAGFKPKRTVILSFGFDEESSGTQGAGHLAPYLLERYGENGVAAIVDEGMGYAEAFGRGFAVPGVAEKGYIDVEVTVRTPGGHSSIPPEHTSIGILGEIIVALENVQYPPYLADENPYLGFLQCSAEYAPDFPKKLKKLLGDRSSSKNRPAKENDRLAQEAAKISKEARYLMQTSQAIDIVKGGTKLNALPESAVLSVNHRINIGDDPDTVQKHLTSVVKPIAQKYNLTLHAFDGTSAGYKAISLAARKNVLEVAPVTPIDTDVVTAYSILSGTIRALYGEDTVVAPALMTGNTDTRFYWDLTKNIFRFGPGMVNDQTGMGNVHTVDEHVSLKNHLNVVRWFTLFLRNIDEAELEVD